MREERTGDAGHAQTPILLIHGVGHHKPGAIAGKVGQELRERSLDGFKAFEFNWDHAIKSATGTGSFFLSPQPFYDLARASRAAAWIGTELPPGPGGHLLRWLWSALSLTGLAWVLCGLWYGVARYGASLSTEVQPLRIGLPPSAYLFPPLPADLVARSASIAVEGLRIAVGAHMVYLPVLIALTWICTRRPLATVVRTGLIEGLWPVVYLVGIIPPALAALGVGIVVTGVANLVFQLKVRVELDDGVSWMIGPGFTDLGLAVLQAAVVVGVGIAAAALIWRVSKPVFDILRYLGDPSARRLIHRELEHYVGRLPQSDRVVIAAHSLGSVIAVDSLISSPDIWSRFERIDLVTAGSPLRRLLHRFYPDAYPDPPAFVRALSELHARLTWTNIYRVTDYIGGGLRAPAIRDHRIWRRPWKNHADYWSDDVVVDRLLDHFRTPVSAPPTPAERRAPLRIEAVEQRLGAPGPRLARVTGFLGLLLGATGMFTIAWTQFSLVPELERGNLDAWTRMIASDPHEDTVVVQPGRMITAASVYGDPVEWELVGFHFAHGDRQIHVESQADAPWFVTPRFPHVRWDSLLADVERSEDGRLEAVVRHASGQPEVFELLGYSAVPEYHTFKRWIFYALRTLVLAVAWVGWVYFVVGLLRGLNPVLERDLAWDPRDW